MSSFTNTQANAISAATKKLSSTRLADTILDGIGGLRERSDIKPPISFSEQEQGLVSLFENLSGINRIRIKENPKSFKTRPLVHSCVEIKPSRKNRLIGSLMSKRTVADITYRSDLTEAQINFAVVKECAHVFIRKSIGEQTTSLMKDWPDMKEEQLDILDELISNDLLRIDLDDEPEGLTPQKIAIWHLERKATRLAMRVLVPKYFYKDMMLHVEQLRKTETSEALEEWLVRMNQVHLKLPDDKFEKLTRGKYSFLNYT